MTTKLLTAAVLALASMGASVAFAGSFTEASNPKFEGEAVYASKNATPFVSTLSRAQVQSEAVAAIKAGTMTVKQGTEDYEVAIARTDSAVSTLSRAQVREEAVIANKNGTAFVAHGPSAHSDAY